VYIVVWAYIDPKIAPALPKEERNVPLPTILKELLVSSVPITLLTVIVLYVIVAGVATPTESAGIGAAGALLIAALYRRVTWASMKESVFLTARTTALVGWLFVGSSLFAATFTILGGSALIERTVLGLGLRGDLFLWLSMATIFLLGWPLEWTEIIVIFIPLFLPLLDDFGIDPTFFGVMVAVNLQTAFLSPPVAMTAFYLKGVAPKHVTLNQIFQGMYPYMAIQFLCLVSLWLWPQLVTWLPDLIYGPAVGPRR
jgi:TRAP-type mannitol/chloroaromatic compound transport system permease large subunit